MILQMPGRELYEYSRRRAYRLRTRAKTWNRPADFSGKAWRDCLIWWGETCAYCGVSADTLGEPLTSDHVIPLVKPGSPGTVRENIIPACYVCNEKKAHHSVGYFLAGHFGPRYAVQALARIEQYIIEVSSSE